MRFVRKGRADMASKLQRITISYAANPGSHFDLVYYREKHLPLVRRLLAPHGLRTITLQTPIDPAANPCHARVHLDFEDLATFKAAMATHGAEINGDIVKFTDVAPQVERSDVQTF